MLKIGDFSKLTRISIRMLRHYDTIGLLAPERIDKFTGYRYYSEAQLPLANRITALRDMGFGLSTVSEILSRYSDPAAFRQYLEIKRSELENQADETRHRLLLLNTAIERLGKDGIAMSYNVTRKILPPRYVASVRQIIPGYSHEGEVWQLMGKETAPLRVQEDTPAYTLVIFHDGSYKEENVDVEAQKSVVGNYPDTEHVKFKKVPAIEMASATYQGSYDLIIEVNQAVANWIHDNGYEISGLGFNIYHVNPHDSPNPADWVTEVCYPIARAH